MKRGIFSFSVLSFFAFFLFPLPVLASVIISEVAWMGTSVSANDEWLELSNEGDANEDLSLYSIEWGSVSSPKIINLAGTIASKGFFLLERTDDLSVPNISADQIYTGALSNTGEKILLKKDGIVLSTYDFSLGWPAGDNTTKDTMQWNGSLWITGAPTPKAQNVLSGSANTPPNNDTSYDQEDEVEDSSGEELSSHLSPVPLSKRGERETVYISAGRERVSIRGVPVTFSLLAWDKGGNTKKIGEVLWSFGDGESAWGDKVSHTYIYPGEYVVVANAKYGEEEAVSRTKITVFSPDISLSYASSTLSLVNNSLFEINLGNWQIDAGTKSSILAIDTIVPAKKSITFSPKVMPIVATGTIKLLSPSGEDISLFAISGPVSLSGAPEVLDNLENIEEPKKEIEEVQKILAEKKSQLASLLQALPRENKKDANLESDLQREDVFISPASLEEAGNVIVINKEKGVLGRFFSWSFKTFNSLRERVF